MKPYTGLSLVEHEDVSFPQSETVDLGPVLRRFLTRAPDFFDVL